MTFWSLLHFKVDPYHKDPFPPGKMWPIRIPDSLFWKQVKVKVKVSIRKNLQQFKHFAANYSLERWSKICHFLYDNIQGKMGELKRERIVQKMADCYSSLTDIHTLICKSHYILSFISFYPWPLKTALKYSFSYFLISLTYLIRTMLLLKCY